MAGIGVRFVGAAMRILLAAIFGDEGIGLYQMAYPVYSSLLAISTAGIPVAVSKLVSENIALRDFREAARVFRIAMVILSLTGLVIALLLFFGAEIVAERIVKEPRAVYPIMAIAPAIFFVTIMSAIRGFFQGQQKMIPTAASQVVEQIGRVAVSLALALWLLPVGLEFAAAGAAAGTDGRRYPGIVAAGNSIFPGSPQFSKSDEAAARAQPCALQPDCEAHFCTCNSDHFRQPDYALEYHDRPGGGAPPASGSRVHRGKGDCPLWPANRHGQFSDLFPQRGYPGVVDEPGPGHFRGLCPAPIFADSQPDRLSGQADHALLPAGCGWPLHPGGADYAPVV